ncbi:MAG: hypothetical protein HQL85_13030 [Magnetococcales bacterium]|nr:hypothetical protein [Magnetococcales bacterium]
MLHADSNPEGSYALASAKGAIAGQRLGNVFVLPSFRDLEDSISLEIRPEHLVTSTAHPPFFLTDALSRLGKELNVDLVIIDLRAGLSELSAPFIFDPRIKRILVANPSWQAIKGTRLLIQEIGNTLNVNQWPVDSLPALILNQLPGAMMPKMGEAGRGELLNVMEESINATFEQAFSQNRRQSAVESPSTTHTQDTDDLLLTSAEEGISRVYLSYNEPLAMLPKDWEETMETIRQSLFPTKIWDMLQLWLPATRIPSPATKKGSQSGKTLDDRRTLLRDFADRLVTAEGSSQNSLEKIGFLSIHPLISLAQDHAAKLPMVVSIGAKGAGKTYSFLNMARTEKWANFVKKVKSDLDCNIEAPILPVLWSKNANTDEMIRLQNGCRDLLALQNTVSGPLFELPRELATFQTQSHDLYVWRDFWADAIARSLGIPKTDSINPFETLLRHLRKNNLNLIAIIDGLEEIFPEFTTSEAQKMALRALIQEIPNWLKTLPGAPLGIIIFIRQDMVLHVIPQNRTQFTDRYKNYALRWTWKEALELAAWVCDKSEATNDLWDQEFSNFTESDLMTRMRPLWGIKLGGDDTNEAKSNTWVLSVLSDLRGRIQARDVVRFLSLAARDSVGNTKTTDRLLIPAAIRSAIVPCSQKKVDEIGEENTPLKEVFNKIQGGNDSQTQIFSPCTFENLAAIGLNQEQVGLMEENGIIFHDTSEKKYHFPEIFRHGLAVERPVGARPRVLSLMRQARNSDRR